MIYNKQILIDKNTARERVGKVLVQSIIYTMLQTLLNRCMKNIFFRDKKVIPTYTELILVTTDFHIFKNSSKSLASSIKMANIWAIYCCFSF